MRGTQRPIATVWPSEPRPLPLLSPALLCCRIPGELLLWPCATRFTFMWIPEQLEYDTAPAFQLLSPKAKTQIATSSGSKRSSVNTSKFHLLMWKLQLNMWGRCECEYLDSRLIPTLQLRLCEGRRGGAEALPCCGSVEDTTGSVSPRRTDPEPAHPQAGRNHPWWVSEEGGGCWSRVNMFQCSCTSNIR